MKWGTNSENNWKSSGWKFLVTSISAFRVSYIWDLPVLYTEMSDTLDTLILASNKVSHYLVYQLN